MRRKSYVKLSRRPKFPKDIRTGQLQINQTDFWSMEKPIWDTSDVFREILSFVSPDVIFCLLPLCKVKNNLEELQRLVLLGVDVNAPNLDGSTALHVAATLGSRGVVQYLTENRADINAVDSLGNTPLNVSILSSLCLFFFGPSYEHA